MNDLTYAQFALLVSDMRNKQKNLLKLAKLGKSPGREFMSELRDLERRVDAAAEFVLSPSLPLEGGER